YVSLIVCPVSLPPSSGCGDHRHLHSFPTRRSSDLRVVLEKVPPEHFGDIRHAHWRTRMTTVGFLHRIHAQGTNGIGSVTTTGHEDRKSTRLNSSHVKISYAVFCLKKKKNTILDDIN